MTETDTENKKNQKPRRLLVWEHPELVKEYADEKDVNELTVGMTYKARWLCRKTDNPHYYHARVDHRAKGSDCPYCSGQKVLVGFNDLATTHPHLVSEWSSENTVNIHNITSGSSKKTLWYCRVCDGTYDSYVYHKVKGFGCPYCSGRRVLAGFNDLATTHPHLVSEWVDAKNIQEFSAGSHYHAQWTCPLGHSYTRRISHKTNTNADNAQCLVCTGFQVLTGFNDLATVHPHLIDEWDDQEDMSAISVGTNYAARWKCEKGHQWVASVKNRTKTLASRCPSCAYTNGQSSAEKEIVEYVQSLGFETAPNRSILNGKELDIYIPERHFAIEYNGLYWHSEAMGKDKWYHYNKWKECKQQGIQLFTVWEDDYARNPDLIKRMIAYKMKLNTHESVRMAARKTTFMRITAAETAIFLDRNHLQDTHHTSRHYGLKDRTDNRLVAVMSVRYSAKKKEVEISRFATENGFIVQGGFTKLLKNMVKEYDDVDKIVSYSHNDHSDGGLYEQNGFGRMHSGTPGYHYVVNNERKHRLNYSPKRFKERHDLKFKEGLTERELADLNGLYRIWDCGSSLWEMSL